MLYVTLTHLVVSVAVIGALTGAFMVAEVAVFQVVLAMVIPDETMSYVVAAIVILVSAVLVVKAGMASHFPEKRRTMQVLLGSWAVLGLVMVIARVVAAGQLAGQADPGGSVLAAALVATQAVDPAAAALISAVVMLALYLAIGVLGYAEARHVSHPLVTAKLRAQRELTRAEAAYLRVQGNALLSRQAVAQRDQERDMLPDEERTGHQSLEAMAADAKHAVRVRLATLLGDPRYSGVVEEPLRPQPERDTGSTGRGPYPVSGDPTRIEREA
ncbi:hypothetical protein QYM41_16355 [Kocuria sp. CPCC 205268]|uniref:hypothetical protein n=1 Tax=Kocuria oxytropis TaxID=3058913 RepID=UPI0034D75447